ncbi:MAG: DsbA family protein [Gammaproteobacteria bacterium]|nr:DsbA family protein [Gammaproteobacteria bacterium]
MPSTSRHTLYYIHDPMCSWCWGFKPLLQQLEQQLPESVDMKYLLGGLAADSQQAMPDDMKNFLQQTWRSIQLKIPGTPFNFDFWTLCQPRRSTHIACRAVIAARRQHVDYEKQMISAIQQAYYLNARNPSDQKVLTALAIDLKLDTVAFTADLNSPATQEILQQEIHLSQRLGAQGFPSLILVNGEVCSTVALDYNHLAVNLQQIMALI